MCRQPVWRLGFLLVGFCGLLPLAPVKAQSPILMDDFESGIDDAQIPTTGPWRINDSAPVAEGLTARYRSTGNPFANGNRYAYLNDPQAATGYGFRFFSTDVTDTGHLVSQIHNQVTTFSFEFYEPAETGSVPNQPGMVFGYYYNLPTTGANPDLNSGGRIYSATLHNGLLNPNALSDGGPIAYAHEIVHTIFMVANDSDADVVGYREGRTVLAGQADLWISLAGAEPIYVASVLNPNAASERYPGGIGFRAFTNDIEEFLINDVLLVSGASFDRSVFDTADALIGDYNQDGTVNAADYTVWRDRFGQSVNLPNRDPANGSGPIGTADFTSWKTRFGDSNAGLGAISVPEPGLYAWLLTVVSFTCAWRRIR